MQTIEKLTTALAATYSIERQIGEGGMATVYLARDLRHNRRVAIKVLRPELQAVLGADRFLAEIEVTANLRHPNLLPLFDSGEADGALYYVMPFIEGESLRAKLTRERELPVHEAVRLTVLAARALDYAHRRGVIHRDLKPENILLEDGQPLIADFGIALAVSKAGGERVTQTGISLGTPQYMSPEQATGDRELDGRSDIYSLGAVLYEMLTAAPPHTGPTAQAVIASLVTQEARAVSELRKSVPPHVEYAIQRALAKVPGDRFATAGDFAAALEDASPRAVPWARSILPRRRVSWPWLAAGALGSVALVTAIWGGWKNRPGGQASVEAGAGVETITLSRDAPLALGTEIPTLGYSSPVVALSPAGTWLAFVAITPTGRMLYLRDMSTGATRPIPGTEGAINAFFSPDGHEVGFVTTDRVKKVSLRSGSVMTLCEARTPVLGWWARHDFIYFTENETSSLSRVRPDGGSAERDLNRGINAGRFSDVLPDGRALAGSYGAGISGDSYQLVLVDLETREATPLRHFGHSARYVPPGYLLFVRGGSVWLVRFDVVSGRTTGEPSVVASNVTVESLFGMAHVAAASTGMIAYVPGADLSVGKLAWADRRGRVSLIDAPEQVYGPLDLAPDDVRIAVQVADVKDYILIWDTRRSEGRRVTGDAHEGLPVWHPDGSLLSTRASDSAGSFLQLRTVHEGNIGSPERLKNTAGAATPAWSPIGDVMALWRWPLAAIEFLDQRTGARMGATLNGWFPSFSPDGRWLAHNSDRAGMNDIFISSVPGGRIIGQVSSGGGMEPVWQRTGELFYRNGNRWYVTRVSAGPEPRWAPPSLAFETEFNDTPGMSYDVTSDGQRLLVVKRTAAVEKSRISIIRNWMESLERAP